MPDRGTDPTYVAAQFMVAVQGIIGRNVPPSQAAVLSVGHIAAGSAGSPNVIPSEVLVSGTARSFSPAVRALLERRLAELAAGIAQAGGCAAESRYLRRYPALINAVEQTSLAVEAAALTVGRENVEPNTPPISGAEDFAFMLEKKPGAYIMIGNGGSEEGGCHNVHSPLYDFNDEILTTGAAYWVNLVQLELGDAPRRRTSSRRRPCPSSSRREDGRRCGRRRRNRSSSRPRAGRGGGLERRRRFEPWKDQAVGKRGENHQRVVAQGGNVLRRLAHGAIDVDVARLAEQAVEWRAVRLLVEAIPARFGCLVDRQVAMIEFDEVVPTRNVVSMTELSRGPNGSWGNDFVLKLLVQAYCIIR